MVAKEYIELNFTIDPLEPGREILVAQISEIGFDGFEETDTGVKAYIASDAFNLDRIKQLEILEHPDFSVLYTRKTWKEENWNRLWEQEYDPVLVSGRVHVRASFHPLPEKVEFDILIDPKMSFGTAHHETTKLMIAQLLKEHANGATVLDMGCGTAVLAILAEKMGAQKVVAIDNDRNAVENARENIKKNNCQNISVQWGDVSKLEGVFDLMLINITKNILIRDMNQYVKNLDDKGVILFSGFYVDDLEDLRIHSREAGMTFDYAEVKNNWAMARFTKD